MIKNPETTIVDSLIKKESFYSLSLRIKARPKTTYRIIRGFSSNETFASLASKIWPIYTANRPLYVCIESDMYLRKYCDGKLRNGDAVMLDSEIQKSGNKNYCFVYGIRPLKQHKWKFAKYVNQSDKKYENLILTLLKSIVSDATRIRLQEKLVEHRQNALLKYKSAWFSDYALSEEKNKVFLKENGYHLYWPTNETRTILVRGKCLGQVSKKSLIKV